MELVASTALPIQAHSNGPSVSEQNVTRCDAAADGLPQRLSGT